MKSNAIEKVAFNLENKKMDGKPVTSFADHQTWAMLSENKVVFIHSKEDDHHLITKYAVIKDETGGKQPYLDLIYNSDAADDALTEVTNFLEL